MRYKLAILFSFFALSGSAQIVKTAGIPYTATTPSHTPSASGSSWAIDTANLDLYAYYNGAWNLAGERIQTISGCTAPAYTPGKGQSVFVINGCDSLYYYRSGAWVRINAGGGGGGAGVSDGDKGDIDVSASGSVWTIDTSAVTRIKIAADAIDSTKIENLRVSLSDIAGAWGVQNGSVLKWNGSNWRPGSDNTGADGNGIYGGDGDIPTNTDATLPINSFLRFEWPSGNTAFIMDDFGDTVYLADPSLASSVLVSASKVGLRSTGNIELWGGTGGAKLRMLEPTGSGANYTQFQVGAQSADITYTLPTTTGSNGQYLQFTTGGQLQWSTVAAGVTDGDKDDITVSGSGANWNIRNDSVTSPKILDGTIALADMGANSVDSTKIGDKTVSLSDLNGAWGANNGSVLKWNGTNWRPATDTDTDAQTLSIDSSIVGSVERFAVAISGGNTVRFDVPQGTFVTDGNKDDISVTNSGANWNIRNDSVTTAKILNGTILFEDIGQNSASPGQVIKWNGTAWAAAADNTGGSGSTDLSWTGASSPYTLNSSSGTDVDFAQGGGITLSTSGATLTIAAVDQSITNEVLTISDGTNTEALGGQTLTVAGGGINSASYNATTNTLTISGTESDGSASNEGILGVGAGSGTTATITTNTTTGNAVTIEGGGIVAITETTSSNGGTITITATESDGSATNELQTIANTSDATSHTVTLSNSGGSVQLIQGAGIDLTTGGNSGAGTVTIASTQVGVTDGDKGDIDVTATGATWTIDTGSVTTGKIANATILFEDVAQNGASTGQAIKWNGTAWAAAADTDTDAQTLSIDSSIVGSSERFAVAISGGNTVRFDVPQGTVTSVGITAPSAGITVVSGSPVTTSGSITLGLANDLATIEGLTSTGIAVRTDNATSAWATRSLTAANPVTISNNSAVSGNPFIFLNAGDFGDVDITNSNIGSNLRGDIWTIDTGSINSVKITNSTILFEDIAANSATNGQVIKYNGSAWVAATDETGGGGVTDGDKGDITVSGSGATWTIDADVVDSTNVGNKTLSVDDINGGWGAATGTPLEWNGTNWRPGVDSSGIYSGSGNIPPNTVANITDYFGFQYDTGQAEAIGFDEVDGSVRLNSSGANDYIIVENDSISIISEGGRIILQTDTLDASGVTGFIGFPSGGGVTDGDKGDIDVTGSGTVWTVDTAAIVTVDIADNAVTYAKLQDVAANSVLARVGTTSGDASAVGLSASNLIGRGSTGDVAPITLGANLSMAGTALNTTGHPTITGTPTTNAIPKWTSASALGSTIVQEAISGADTVIQIVGRDALRLPLGTTAERPGTPTSGMTRYNTTNGAFEYYNASAWETPLLSATGTGLGTAGQIFFADANGRAATDAGLTWNNTNKRLDLVSSGSSASGTISAVSGLASAYSVTGALTATANNNNLYAFNISPTYNNGAFTGVNQRDLSISSTASAKIFAYRAGGGAANIIFAHSRGSVSSPEATINGDNTGNFLFQGYDGSAFVSPAQFGSVVDGTVSTGVIPTSLVFATGSNPTTRANRITIKSSGFVGIGTDTPENNLQVNGTLGRNTPTTVTGNYTVADGVTWLIVNNSASTTITLPDATLWDGRELTIKTIQAQTVVSASSNVHPIDSATAGTAILPATDGAWALLVSNGTNWVIMQRG
jgi:hypothetical protein